MQKWQAYFNLILADSVACEKNSGGNRYKNHAKAIKIRQIGDYKRIEFLLLNWMHKYGDEV